MLTFLFLARAARHKGLPDLLRALTLIERSDWALTVVGGTHPAEDGEVQALASRLPGLQMLGRLPHPHVPGLMRSVDAIVVPSRYENFCNTALEAMASGLPIIGSRCGGIPDLVIDGWNGLLFSPGDSDALAAAITDLLEDPTKARKFGANGRRASMRFDWTVVVRETIALFDSLPPTTSSSRSHISS